jgi:hypothetical protein
MKKLSVISAALFLMFASSCHKDSSVASSKPQANDPAATAARAGTGVSTTANPNTIPNMQAYYDSAFFTIKLKAQPANVAAAIIAHNHGLNNIYASDDLENPQTFFPVLDAIPGDGMNPNWLRMQIVFNNGFAPHQFYSDDEVNTAAANGEISLVNTGEVYICAVISH